MWRTRQLGCNLFILIKCLFGMQFATGHKDYHDDLIYLNGNVASGNGSVTVKRKGNLFSASVSRFCHFYVIYCFNW